jgi:hypothetical protein
MSLTVYCYSPSTYFGTGVGATQYEQWENYREHTSSDEKALRNVGEQSQRQSKAEKIGPVVFDECQARMQLPAHVEPGTKIKLRRKFLNFQNIDSTIYIRSCTANRAVRCE